MNNTTPILNITGLPVHAFDAWLADKPATQRVGIAEDCGQCPIAQWLFEEYGAVCLVSSFGVDLCEMGGKRFTPWPTQEPAPWMMPFIDLLDGAAREDNVSRIAAGYAREVLGRVLAMEVTA